MAKIVTELRDLRSAVLALNESIMLLASEEIKFHAHPSQFIRLRVENLEDALVSNYLAALHRVRTVSELVSEATPTVIPRSHEFPTAAQLRQSLSNFLRGSVKNSITPYCGSFSSRMRNPRRGEFVCAHHNDAFILVTVWQVSERSCSVFDPMDKDDVVKLIELQNDCWTAVPRSVPEMPSPSWEYKRGATVLALWPLERPGEWTTEFYEATVVAMPSERQGTRPRGYALDFGDGRSQIVPEQFVVPVKTLW